MKYQPRRSYRAAVLYWHRIDAAEVDREPCRHGHLDCAIADGGSCIDEISHELAAAGLLDDERHELTAAGLAVLSKSIPTKGATEHDDSEPDQETM